MILRFLPVSIQLVSQRVGRHDGDITNDLLACFHSVGFPASGKGRGLNP